MEKENERRERKKWKREEYLKWLTQLSRTTFVNKLTNYGINTLFSAFATHHLFYNGINPEKREELYLTYY